MAELFWEVLSHYQTWRVLQVTQCCRTSLMLLILMLVLAKNEQTILLCWFLCKFDSYAGTYDLQKTAICSHSEVWHWFVIFPSTCLPTLKPWCISCSWGPAVMLPSNAKHHIYGRGNAQTTILRIHCFLWMSYQMEPLFTIWPPVSPKL